MLFNGAHGVLPVIASEELCGSQEERGVLCGFLVLVDLIISLSVCSLSVARRRSCRSAVGHRSGTWMCVRALFACLFVCLGACVCTSFVLLSACVYLLPFICMSACVYLVPFLVRSLMVGNWARFFFGSHGCPARVVFAPAFLAVTAILPSVLAEPLLSLLCRSRCYAFNFSWALAFFALPQQMLCLQF
jgi:hypothetical protein